MKLKGKIALITGGTSGIGLETAKLFIREGARVIVTGRDKARLEQTKEELGTSSTVIMADVSSADEMKGVRNRIADEFGKLDIYFANAGVAQSTPLATTDEATYDLIMDINVKGMFFSMQILEPVLRDGASVILNTSFINQTGFSGLAVLAASKAAVRSFARTWSRELLERRIRVNAVSPGIIHTPIQDKLAGGPEEVKEMRTQLAKMVPVGHIGRPEDIGHAALFLASDDSQYVVGAELVVDGGISQL